jgi:outer membrane protein OmpA-like peptidoglycan-associated protein
MLKGVAEVLAIRRDANGLTAAIRLAKPGSLDDYRVLETATGRLFPDMAVRLVPPVSDPPPIQFAAGRTTLDAAGERAVNTIDWAFARWGVTAARVEGSASPSGRRGPTRRDRALAAARATSVAKALKDLGLTQVETTSNAPDTSGDDAASLQRAVVRPLGAAPLGTPASDAGGVPAN